VDSKWKASYSNEFILTTLKWRYKKILKCCLFWKCQILPFDKEAQTSDFINPGSNIGSSLLQSKKSLTIVTDSYFSKHYTTGAFVVGGTSGLPEGVMFWM
jgi:hypothetical protein